MIELKEYVREVIREYAGINIMAAPGQGTMGTKGDASFFGPDASMKGGVKRSIYKVPKSSIHGESDEDDNLIPAFYDDDDQEGKGKISYINDKSVPKTSIHNQKFGEMEETAGFPGTTSKGGMGDASFIGASGIRKGGNDRKPVFKTPKSSIYYKKGRFPGEADFYNDDNWETDEPGPSTDVSGKRPYVGNKSVPKSSIHYDEIPDENRRYISTQEQLGIPMSADGTIDGGPRSMDPVVGKKTKKKEFADASKYGYPKEGKSEYLTYENLENNKDVFMINWSENEKMKKELEQNEGKGELTQAGDLIEEIYWESGVMEWLNMHNEELADKIVNYVEQVANKKNINEEKDYDTTIVPKTSIHYGERDKVKGQPKMRFEKTITKEAGFVPDEIKNLKTQGDWKSNLSKAVLDLTGEAQPQEPTIPVPIVGIGDTPEFPYKSEIDGNMIYPIPGMNMTATRNGEEWTFGDTEPLPASQEESPSSGCAIGHGEASTGEIDIPCTQKPMIKKLMMLIKKEQTNLHEGISLRGIYEGKVVKLNTIFGGEHRRFKTFVKTNEGKVMKVHFGPPINENFKEFANQMIDYEIETAKEENFPNLERHLKKLENLRNISDPNRFKSMYMRVTGANKWDLPNELLSYLHEDCISMEGITRRGSQTREPIGDTDYEVVSKTGNEVILKDKETGEKEVWVENDDFAGYVIEIGGRGYEFTHGVKI